MLSPGSRRSHGCHGSAQGTSPMTTGSQTVSVGWQIAIWGSIAVSVVTGIILNSVFNFNFGESLGCVFGIQVVFSTIMMVVWRRQVAGGRGR